MIKTWKVLRNQKGFTLVELMIVVAVIGILALVLIPKVGTIKTQAKAAGIDVNERMVQAIVQAQISDYAGKGSVPAASGAVPNETNFANAIVNALSNQVDPSQNIKDPFNSWSDTATVGTAPDGLHAVFVSASTPTIATTLPTAGPNNVGIIFVQVFPASATPNCDIYVTITPFDADGNAITTKQVTIRP